MEEEEGLQQFIEEEGGALTYNEVYVWGGNYSCSNIYRRFKWATWPLWFVPRES